MYSNIHQKRIFAIDKIMSEFIWNKRIPRIKKFFLQRPKSAGGMGLPNFQFYYWASNVRIMAYWLQKQPPLWLHILLLSPLPTAYPESLGNPVVSHSLKIWSQVRRFYGWQAGSLQSPLIENHSFAPSFINAIFDDCFEKSIHGFIDIFTDNVFPSFEQAQTNTAHLGHTFINICR